MDKAPFEDAQPSAFSLQLLEFSVQLFRGPGPDCGAMFREWLPSLILECPPEQPELCRALEDLQAVSASPEADEATMEAFCQDLESEYVRLFISSLGGAPAPLYESCHTEASGRTMGKAAQDMARLLDAAGLEVAQAGEPPDHLAIELEYLYHLCWRGLMDDDRQARDAAAGFARRTMQPWVKKLSLAVHEAAPDSLFSFAAALLVKLLEDLGQRA